MKKLVAAALLALCALSLNASASVLTGDTVTITFNPGVYTRNFTVGAGTDFTVGVFRMDLNGGANGNEFTFNDGPGNGSFAGSSSFTLSGLNFTDGSLLSGFTLISSLLSDFSFSTTADSITFNYSNLVAPDGLVIDGLFNTGAAPSAVPLPSTLPLTLLGLSALGLSLRARQRSSRL